MGCDISLHLCLLLEGRGPEDWEGPRGLQAPHWHLHTPTHKVDLERPQNRRQVGVLQGCQGQPGVSGLSAYLSLQKMPGQCRGRARAAGLEGSCLGVESQPLASGAARPGPGWEGALTQVGAPGGVRHRAWRRPRSVEPRGGKGRTPSLREAGRPACTCASCGQANLDLVGGWPESYEDPSKAPKSSWWHFWVEETVQTKASVGTTRLSGDAGCPPGTRGTGSHQPGPLLPPDSGLGLPHSQTRLVQGSLQAGRLGYYCEGPRVEVPGGGGQGRPPVRVWLFSGSLGPRDVAVCPRLGVDERPGALPVPSRPSLSCCSAFIPPPSRGSHRAPGSPRAQLPPPPALHGPWGCSPSLLSAGTHLLTPSV